MLHRDAKTGFPNFQFSQKPLKPSTAASFWGGTGSADFQTVAFRHTILDRDAKIVFSDFPKIRFLHLDRE